MVVVDELADMMMVVGKKVEELIARLAQKARRRHPPHPRHPAPLGGRDHRPDQGQRAHAHRLPGVSKIDSRTILDQMGAETLLGMGDMFTWSARCPTRRWVYGAFVADEEVHKVVDHLKKIGPPDYVEGILSAAEDDVDAALGGGGDGGTASRTRSTTRPWRSW